MNAEDMEGRLIAHRRLLQLIVGAMAGTPQGDGLRELLRERTTLQDGQEDPGAVETEGMGIALAVSDEFRRVVEGVADIVAEGGRPGGAASS